MASLARVTDWFFGGNSARARNESQEPVLAGKLKVWVESSELEVEGKLIALSRDEVDLLIFLAKHPKHFVSPHTALSTRWDSGTGRTDFLRVLRSLQKRMEDSGVTGRYIRVEPWYLYSFDPTA